LFIYETCFIDMTKSLINYGICRLAAAQLSAGLCKCWIYWWVLAILHLFSLLHCWDLTMYTSICW